MSIYIIFALWALSAAGVAVCVYIEIQDRKREQKWRAHMHRRGVFKPRGDDQ